MIEESRCPKCGDSDFIGKFVKGKLIGHYCLNCDYKEKLR